jgi:hypothetical protein
MEHMLWEAIGSKGPIDVEAAARAMSALLWAALSAPGAELAALRALRGEVAQALDQAARV